MNFQIGYVHIRNNREKRKNQKSYEVYSDEHANNISFHFFNQSIPLIAEHYKIRILVPILVVIVRLGNQNRHYLFDVCVCR